MSAVLVQVADAVVALLNTPGAFSQQFTAKRSYPTWKIPLTKLGPLRVDVVPSRHAQSSVDTQGSVGYACKVMIVVRCKFGQDARQEETDEGRPISNEAIDALVLLVEEIHEYLAGEDQRILLTPVAEELAQWDAASEIQNTYIDTHLQDHQQFTALIPVTYTLSKDV